MPSCASESIAGVTTIHFARWTFIDDHRRMLFAIVDETAEAGPEQP